MRLQLATWPEVDEYLRTYKGIIMPIGSTEQHGPSGLVGTDALTAEAIGQRLGDEVVVQRPKGDTVYEILEIDYAEAEAETDTAGRGARKQRHGGDGAS